MLSSWGAKMMTKRDFQKIATILKNSQHNNNFVELCSDFANYLEGKNPKVNRDLFLEACGVEK